MIEAFIGLGSNLGDRNYYLQEAICSLGSSPEVVVKQVSSVRETEPQGGPPQGKYLNAVMKIETSLSAHQLLCLLQELENKLARVRTVKNGPRTIDADLLLYGEQIINEPDLTVPHPRMFEREFVMGPLLEIAPEIKKRLARLRACRLQVKQS